MRVKVNKGKSMFERGFKLGSPGFVADGVRHVVEGEALAARYGSLLHVVGPWGEHQQEASRASLEVLAWWLVERREPILEDDDERMPGIQCGACYLLLSSRDAGTHHDATLPSAFQEVSLLSRNQPQVVRRGVVVAAHLHPHSSVQQPPVTDGSAPDAAHLKFRHNPEQVRVPLLNAKSPWVAPCPCSWEHRTSFLHASWLKGKSGGKIALPPLLYPAPGHNRL